MQEVKYKIVEEDKFYIGELYINNVLVIKTYPQMSRVNCIMLLNKRIGRLNNMNGSYISSYKDSK